MQLKTVGQIAKTLHIPTHCIKYAIERYRIQETQRAGVIRLFDQDTVEAIKRAVKRTTRKKFL